MWKFAACHSFLEVEEYCRSSPFVAGILKYILCQPSHGLEAFSKHGIKLEVMSRVVRDLITRDKIPVEGKYCLGCKRWAGTVVCHECQKDGADCFNWDYVKSEDGGKMDVLSALIDIICQSGLLTLRPHASMERWRSHAKVSIVNWKSSIVIG